MTLFTEKSAEIHKMPPGALHTCVTVKGVCVSIAGLQCKQNKVEKVFFRDGLRNRKRNDLGTHLARQQRRHVQPWRTASCVSNAFVMFSTVTLAAFTAFLTHIQTEQVGTQPTKIGRHVDDVSWKVSMIGYEEDDEDDEDDKCERDGGESPPQPDFIRR